MTTRINIMVKKINHLQEKGRNDHNIKYELKEVDKQVIV